MQGNAVKDSRWFAFFDSGAAWDAQWHSQALCDAYAFWTEGKDPWALPNVSQGPSEDHYSMRVFAFNAALIVMAEFALLTMGPDFRDPVVDSMFVLEVALQNISASQPWPKTLQTLIASC